MKMKGIKGYPNYKITTDGRVWSDNKNDFLVPSLVEGYKRVSLCNNGKIKNVFIHRLVAETFIPNPNKYPIINHKDENKLNNNVENLEWCTYQYNNTYGEGAKQRTVTQTNRPDCSKPVIQYTLNWEFVAEYPSCKEAKRQTGIGHISECINHYKNQYTAGGYRWAWKGVNI